MIRINSTKRILESSRFNVETVEFTFDSLDTKKPKIFQRDIVRHPGAVVILPIDKDGKILFVTQPRLALNRQFIELPAGTIDNNEEPIECAKRELAEEIGMAASSWTALGEIFPAPGFCDEKLSLFVARDLTEYHLTPDPEEKIEVRSLSKTEVFEIVSNGTLQDAKSLAFLFRAQMAGIW